MADAGPALPRHPREATLAWFTEVLRASGAARHARVVAAELEPLGTFSAELWRARLRYDRVEPGAPASLVLKRRSRRPERRHEGFEQELGFYRDAATATPVRTPRLHFGKVEPHGGAALLVLEDVAIVPTFAWQRGADPAHARAGLEALARLHAHWWRRADALDFAPALAAPEVRTAFAEDYDRGWPACRALLREVCEPFVAIGDALVGRLAASLAPLGAPATLLHGDAHAENLPLLGAGAERVSARAEVACLDWAGARRGTPGFDVAVFAVMSVPVAERRRREREWVACHAEALAAAGVGDAPDPWLDYRRGVLRRAARVVEIAAGFPHDAVGRAALRMVAERCARAAVDLDVGELVASA